MSNEKIIIKRRKDMSQTRCSGTRQNKTCHGHLYRCKKCGHV